MSSIKKRGLKKISNKSNETSDAKSTEASDESSKLPKQLDNKIDRALLPDKRGRLYTLEQKKLIEEAIKQDKELNPPDKQLQKIRRVFAGKPGSKIERKFNPGKAPTELEKQLLLEHSILITEKGEAIALGHGDEFILGDKRDKSSSVKVIVGQQVKDGTWVAVKISHLDPKYSRSEDLKRSRDLIENESQIGQKVQHEIGSVKRTSNAVEKFYSIQILYEGDAVVDYFSGKTENPPQSIKKELQDRTIVVRLANQELKKLHDQNIVHGDIRPDNMIFFAKTEPKMLKIFDFGRSIQLNPSNTSLALDKNPNLIAKHKDIKALATFYETLRLEAAFNPELRSSLKKLIADMKDENNIFSIDTVMTEYERLYILNQQYMENENLLSTATHHVPQTKDQTTESKDNVNRNQPIELKINEEHAAQVNKLDQMNKLVQFILENNYNEIASGIEKKEFTAEIFRDISSKLQEDKIRFDSDDIFEVLKIFEDNEDKQNSAFEILYKAGYKINLNASFDRFCNYKKERSFITAYLNKFYHFYSQQEKSELKVHVQDHSNATATVKKNFLKHITDIPEKFPHLTPLLDLHTHPHQTASSNKSADNKDSKDKKDTTPPPSQTDKPH